MPVKKAAQSYPNLFLRRLRQEQGWSQKEVADRIDVAHAFMISRWESGAATPGPEYRQRLCELFGKSPRELGFFKQPSLPVAANPQVPIYDFMLPFRLSTAQTVVGRTELLADLVQRLCHQDERQLFAFSGLPGVGKTTLAVELAHTPEIRNYFQDGILWGALGPQANIFALLSRWGKLLNMDENEVKSLRSYDDWSAALCAAIGSRRMFIIIDDAWSLEDALRCKVGGPHCSYLLTTRIPEISMYFASDQVVPVPELGLNDGIDLITRIAPALVDLYPDAPRMLVESVGGLPLALILIGNYLLLQTRHFQHRRTQSALSKLQESETRLTLEFPIAGLNQETGQLVKMSLQTVIHTSETRLDTISRQALSALAVFPPKPDSFSEEAALAVAEAEVEVIDHLVDVGMIEINRQGRYQMHQVISDYERLEGHNSEAETRMLSYIVNFAERFRDDHNSLEQELAIITRSLQLAFEQKQYELLIRGAVACSKFLYSYGLQLVSESMLRNALLASELSHDVKRRIVILRDLTNIVKMLGNYSEAQALAEECLALQRQENQTPEIASEVLAHLGHIALQKGNYEAAKAYLHEGLVLARQHRLSKQICRLLGLLGIVVEFQGDFAQAERYWREGSRIAQRAGEPESFAYICGVLGSKLCEYERYEEGEEYLQKGLSLSQQLGSRPEICHFLLDLGDLALRRKENDKAEAYFQESLSLARIMRLHPALSAILLNLGELAVERSEYEEAEKYLQESLEFAQQRENSYFVSVIHVTQGDIYLKRKELKQAEYAFQAALEAAPDENWVLIARARYGLARVHLLCGERQKAWEQGMESLRTFEKTSAPQATEVRGWLEAYFEARVE